MANLSLMTSKSFFTLLATLLGMAFCQMPVIHAANPIFPGVYTADPAALVHGDTVYIYAGNDEAPPNTSYRMNKWLCYSSKDMRTWKAEGSPLAARDFSWAVGDAWASQVIEKNGRFYWYSCVEHNASKRGKAIGVAVSDSPTGPFKDARGTALITADMTTRENHSWEDIDPSVFTDKYGTSYIFWGNVNCYYAKLKPNMTELDGPIMPVDIPRFTEAPWIHKRDNLYYLSYATEFPEKIAYATATNIAGPWTYRGLLAEVAGNSNTIHQAIIEFKNQWYFIYHNGTLPGGDSFRRSVCVDYLYYNSDGTMKRVVQSTEGIDLPPSNTSQTDVNLKPLWNRIQSFNNPNLYIRHANYKALVSSYPFLPYDDTMWKIVPGLADSNGVSFEALYFPNHFLRHKGSEVFIEKNDDSTNFKKSATFFKETGLADKNSFSFRAIDTPNQYLRHSNGVVLVEKLASTTDKAEATFRLTYEGPSTSTVSVAKLNPLEWRNPIIAQRADPHINLQPDGTYYLTASVPEYDRIELR